MQWPRTAEMFGLQGGPEHGMAANQRLQTHPSEPRVVTPFTLYCHDVSWLLLRLLIMTLKLLYHNVSLQPVHSNKALKLQVLSYNLKAAHDVTPQV